ncbi:MAG: hypothetical protein ACC613_12465 [Synergistales bacterium]|jgi:hypothetical protein
MRRKTGFLLAFLLILSFPLIAAGQETRTFRGNFTPASRGEELLKALVDYADPDSVEMILDGEPDEGWNVRDLFFRVRGGLFAGKIRVEDIALSASFVSLAPPSGGGKLEVRSAMRSNIEVVLLESDVNGAIRTFTSDKDGNWRDVSVRFVPPRNIEARGRYHVKNPGLVILAEVDTGLAIREGREIWLEDTRLRINNAEQTATVREAIEKLQPVVDIRKFPFPVSLAVLNTGQGRLEIASRTRPCPFEGIVYRYSR